MFHEATQPDERARWETDIEMITSQAASFQVHDPAAVQRIEGMFEAMHEVVDAVKSNCIDVFQFVKLCQVIQVYRGGVPQDVRDKMQESSLCRLWSCSQLVISPDQLEHMASLFFPQVILELAKAEASITGDIEEGEALRAKVYGMFGSVAIAVSTFIGGFAKDWLEGKRQGKC